MNYFRPKSILFSLLMVFFLSSYLGARQQLLLLLPEGATYTHVIDHAARRVTFDFPGLSVVDLHTNVLQAVIGKESSQLDPMVIPTAQGAGLVLSLNTLSCPVVTVNLNTDIHYLIISIEDAVKKKKYHRRCNDMVLVSV